jgi:predicted rRNA methylase YqxC with S4 and FtsJ domains
VEVVTLDLSYLALANAVPQLDRIRLAANVEAVALVKAQFELGVAGQPRSSEAIRDAVARAAAGFEAAGWRVLASRESPVAGTRGAVEHLLHARR